MTPDMKTRTNKKQKTAIETTDGPVLIIAGPGSGKTYTLVERIVHLVSDKGANPENLFVATFTDKAAKELVTRISTRLNEIDELVQDLEYYEQSPDASTNLET
jgi:DNA helicase-2/ATP-dependent DNA helicase PcrA